jgi:alkylhydroperoxidase family enzyme
MAGYEQLTQASRSDVNTDNFAVSHMLASKQALTATVSATLTSWWDAILTAIRRSMESKLSKGVAGVVSSARGM